MKKALLILSVFFVVSCGVPESMKAPDYDEATVLTKRVNSTLDVSVIEVDGCEYVAIYGGYQTGVSIIHKANCKNHNPPQ